MSTMFYGNIRILWVINKKGDDFLCKIPYRQESNSSATIRISL